MQTRINRIPEPRWGVSAVIVAAHIFAAVLGLPSTLAANETGATPQTPSARADFYVAPDGNNTNSGGAAAPFATLARAHNAVREKVAAGLTKDILVVIRGGTYYQADTLTFGPEDSGSQKHTITYAAYPGDKVVMSGGRKITGWNKGNGKIWTTILPEVKTGKWYFQQLFVNGNRAIIARTPNGDDPTPWWLIKSATFTEKPQDGSPPPEFIKAMESVAGLEPPFRQAMMKTQHEPYDLRVLTGENARASGCGVYQFDCPKGGQGVVEIVCGPESKGDSLLVRLYGLDASAPYDLKAYVGTLSRADDRFYSGTFFGNCDKKLFTTYLAALGDLPILSDVVAQPLSDVVSTPGDGKHKVSGRELCEQGLPVRLAKSPGVVWIAYQRVR